MFHLANNIIWKFVGVFHYNLSNILKLSIDNHHLWQIFEIVPGFDGICWGLKKHRECTKHYVNAQEAHVEDSQEWLDWLERGFEEKADHDCVLDQYFIKYFYLVPSSMFVRSDDD